MKTIKTIAMITALLVVSTTAMAESNYVYRKSLGHYEPYKTENANQSGADIQDGQRVRAGSSMDTNR